MQCFASWSGGKESALALYRAIGQGYRPARLLNFTSEDGQTSRSHGLSASALRVQANAIDVPLLQVSTSWQEYEANFKRAVKGLRKEGVEAGIFGDIDLQEHREWIERVCGEEGIHPVLPLWGSDQHALVRDFLRLGFRARVVATGLAPELLGSYLDEAFLDRLAAYGCTPCGEAGEYHTFVVAGPIFKAPLVLTDGSHYTRDGVHFLELNAEA
ncbi:MAG: diphthine--ammonia ligase [Chloroflexota bacterium]